MKKLFFVTIIIGIILSAACTSVFAEELTASSYTTAAGNTSGENYDDPFTRLIHSDRALDELPPDRVELTDEEKLKLAQDYIAQYGSRGCRVEANAEDYTVLCFKNLSNGMKLVFVEAKDWEYNDSVGLEPLGKYAYCHGGDRTVKLYKNGVYTEIFDAYTSGKINDAMIEEINTVMHFDRLTEPKKQPPTEPETTEETQPIETTVEVQETTEVTTAPETKPATRDSISTHDSVSTIGTANRDNGTIATGDGAVLGIVITLTLAALITAAFVIYKKKLVK